MIITLLWANKGASKVDLTPLIVVRSGSAATEAPRVHNDESREFITLDPGDSTEYDVGVVVPAAVQNAVTMEITDPAGSLAAVQVMPRAELVLVGECGHWLPIEAPEIFCSEVTAFLRRLR